MMASAWGIHNATMETQFREMGVLSLANLKLVIAVIRTQVGLMSVLT